MKASFFLSFLLFLSFFRGASQPFFPADDHIFRTDVIPRVDITIDADSLQWIYDHVDSDVEFHALFVFSAVGEVDSIADVGFRLRGNTSRFSAKKSFKVSFNSFESGRKFHGIEKMNLNGEHNDPSIIRAHLAWNLFAKMQVPGSRSNHVDVYINNQYYGLYINVEHVDEEFVESRFDNKFGNLYKCLYPANLSYLGTNENDYKNNGYELHTNVDKDDYSDLINFIKTLNNSTSSTLPQNIEPIFNINGFLRYLAVEIFTGHWDAYSFNKNNFYLYNNPYTGKFEFLPYDVDNTFGIDWFGIDWGTRNIYSWWADWEDRPLTSKILSNQVYRDRFSFFMNELVTRYADPTPYFAEIDGIKSKINTSAENDVYRTLDYGWDFNDFNRSYTEALGAHVKYGIKPYITARVNSIKTQLDLNPISPIIENVYHNYPQPSEIITISAWLTDDEENPAIKVYYQIDGGTEHTLDMALQTGNTYSVSIPAVYPSGTVTYYLVATDKSNTTTREPSVGAYSIKVGISNSTLAINELMTGNTISVVDNYGQTDDWVELKNTGSASLSLKGKYLTDDATDKTKWGLPDVTLQPGGFFLIWADNDTKQGPNHANFKLSQSGETLSLFDSFENNYALIETLTFTPQDDDVSYGKNETNVFVQQDFITPGDENQLESAAYITMNFNMNEQLLKGNFIPGEDYLDIAGTFNDWNGGDKIYDANGDGIYSITLFGFSANQEIQYKARINGSWATAEFSELGGDGNRKYIVGKGLNTLTHWYNDEETALAQYQSNGSLQVYPNPSHGGSFEVSGADDLGRLVLYDLSGKVVWGAFIQESVVQLNLSLQPGIYLLTAMNKGQKIAKKILVQ
jgi:hypothetical protein